MLGLIARVEDLRRRIDALRCSSPAAIVGKIHRLKSRKADLMRELRLIGDAIIVLIGDAISAEETKFAELPNAIDGFEQEKSQYAQQANRLHKNIQPISGSANADLKKIKQADEIRLRAIDTIRSLSFKNSIVLCPSRQNHIVANIMTLSPFG
jgi:hypothetical protein